MFAQVFSIRTTDPDIRERGRLLKGAAVLIFAAAVLVLVGEGFQWLGWDWMVLTIGIIGMSGGVFALAHYSYIKSGGIILTSAILGAVTYITATNTVDVNFINVAPFVVPLLLAGLVLGSTGVLAFGPLTFAAIVGAAISSGIEWSSALIGPLLVIGLTIGLTWLVMRTLEGAVARARLQTQASLSTQHALEEQRAAIHAKNEELTSANDQMMSLLALVRDLETPVIPLLDDVMLLPLVGHIDTRRAAQLNETVLEAVHRQRAKLLLVDITGVSVVDTAVAQRIVQLAHAVQLLGAKVILTGIRAEIAQTIVAQGMDLSAIQTAGRLQDSVATVLRRVAAQETHA